MTTDRRSFLRGALLGGVVAAVPGPLRAIARAACPRWVPTILRVSTPSLRATWLAVTAVAARAAAARAWLAASGAGGSVILRTLMRRGAPPFWFNPVFRPSLVSLTTGEVR